MFTKKTVALVAAATAGAVAYWRYSARSKEAPFVPSPHGGLDPKDFVPMTVKAVSPYNHNTKFVFFELDNPTAKVNMPLASYLLTRAPIGEEGKPVVRPYTPIHTGQPGIMTLLVKEYPAGVMSKHISSLKPGDKLEIKGPNPKIKWEPNSKKEVTLIAGGTGLTPMLQLIEGVLANPLDRTKLHLVFANVTPADILLKDELDSLARLNKDVLKISYVLEKPPVGWAGVSGFLDAPKLKTLIAPPSADHQVMVCGPPGMMKAISGPKAPDYSQGELDGALKELGFTKDQVYKF